MYSSNLIKLYKELRQEIKDFSRFENKTPRKIHIIKNHAIWISIFGEIKERNLGKKIDCEE